MRKKIGFTFIFIVIAGMVLYTGYTSQDYPVASVAGEFISANELSRTSVALSTYYLQALKVYSGTIPQDTNAFAAEMRIAALQALIDDRLTELELLKTFSPDELQARLKAMVDPIVAQTSLESVQALFTLTLDEFKAYVLLPQARRELLGELGSAYEEVIVRARKNTSISVLLQNMTVVDGIIELSDTPSYTAQIKQTFTELGNLIASSTVATTTVAQ